MHSRETKTDFLESFAIKDQHDRFIGPFGIMLNTPAIGESFFQLATRLGNIAGLSAEAREVAILVVGVEQEAAYELYAHKRLAEHSELSNQIVEKILAGQKPPNLSPDLSIAFDIAKALMSKRGNLDQDLWDQAVDVFGISGATSLVHYVGFYSYTCIILRGFDTKVPSHEDQDDKAL